MWTDAEDALDALIFSDKRDGVKVTHDAHSI